MLAHTTYGTCGPQIILLHWLGGSANTWTEVATGLAARGVVCTALDLPGFAREAGLSSLSIAQMAAAVIDTIQQIRSSGPDTHSEPLLLAGHSMGGKLAAILARAAKEGHPALANLQGLILVSPSPPGPEPMDEKTRQQMLDSLGHITDDAEQNRAHAESFVDNNTGKLPLLDGIRTRTVDDVLHMNPAALVAWLTTGSKEDWSAHVGTLQLPALVLAGTEEPSLGPDTQQQQTLPHLPHATLVPLVGGGHLGPLERPAELVTRIAYWIERTLGLTLTPETSLAPNFHDLIESDRTSPQTRAVLNQRLADDTPTTPQALSTEDLLTLSAIAARLFPGCAFDLAARADRWLALPLHDGWRHNSLPPDIEAWRTGIHSLNAAALRLHGVPFLALDAARQDDLLIQSRDGKLTPGLFERLHLYEGPNFTAAQLKTWFGDLTGQLAMFYAADPRTMQRIGFTGFADEAGFTQIQLGQREDFEV